MGLERYIGGSGHIGISIATVENIFPTTILKRQVS